MAFHHLSVWYTLEKGWTILGNKIKIYCDDGPAGRISYNSTVHPLLLALNLTEVYTLTVGLKEMAKGTVYQDVAGYLADAVYSQLSDYGEKILAGTGQNNLRQISPRFRQERPVLEQSRGANLIYLMKQGQRCRTKYDNGSGVVNNAEGVPTVPPGRVRTVGILGTELQIPLDRIIMITPLENYR